MRESQRWMFVHTTSVSQHENTRRARRCGAFVAMRTMCFVRMRFMLPKRRCWNVENMWVMPFDSTFSYSQELYLGSPFQHLRSKICVWGAYNCAIVCIPNTDFGNRYKRVACISQAFVNVSSLILLDHFENSHHREVLGKCTPLACFVFQKSSFDEHTIVWSLLR